MNKPPVMITRRLFPAAEELLRSRFRIARSPRGAEGILVQLNDRIDARFFDRAPLLRVVSQCAVGVDNIDRREAARRGITVMNTPGVLTEATADLTWALILAVARRVPQADRFCREGRFTGWDLELMLGKDLTGKSLGIIGMGRIGTAVARRAPGFGMTVLHHRGGGGIGPSAPRSKPMTLARLLKQSDVVSLHVPASPATHRLIGAEQLALMKPGAILINTSRGTVVDERALAAALSGGRLWGAGLDVFEREPRIPAALRRQPRVVLTPHIASATRETRGAMALTAVRNLIDFFSGRPDPSRVVAPDC